jgi:hypothetical protein
MKYFGIITLLVIGLSSYGQKKNPYEDYWKEQEKVEQAQGLANKAHLKFQEGDLKKALALYEQASNIQPDNQKYIAKMRDLKILIEKRDKQIQSSSDNAEPEEEGYTESDTTPTENLDSIERVIELSTDSILEKPEKSIKPQPKTKISSEVEKESPINEDTLLPTQVLPKMEESEKPNEQPKEKPYKNSDNYKKYLATIYPNGWSREELTEGNKKILKLVFVEGIRGTEYQQVTHHYGAVFYFRNGESISYAAWVAETKTAPKK